jgi:dihydrolipoamide dehydrogenase
MKQFDAIVIGAGPGGYVCAIRLAQLGIKTACVEKEYFGGVCLNVGCIPSKAIIHAASTIWKIRNEAAHMGINVSEPKLDLAKTQAWKNGVVKQLTGGISGLFKNNGVESFKGNATFKDAKTLEVKLADGKTETITAKNIVIATGSRPVEVPILKYNGKNIVDSTGALDFAELPKKLVVIGGGFIGVEIGMAYAKMGAKVTIVEFGPSILPAIDRDLVQVVEKKMRKLGIEVLANTKATGLQEKDAAKATTLHLEVESQGKKSVVEASRILVSVGRKPNTDGIGLRESRRQTRRARKHYHQQFKPDRRPRRLRHWRCGGCSSTRTPCDDEQPISCSHDCRRAFLQGLQNSAVGRVLRSGNRSGGLKRKRSHRKRH